MKLHLKIWRQDGPKDRGRFEKYVLDPVSPELTLLEALDLLNERLVGENLRPIAFESDCREGICGACGVVVDGAPHGAARRTTTCQIPLRSLPERDEVVLEPFRSAVFPVVRDLVVDRGALDRIIQSGGYVSVRTGAAPDANVTLVGRDVTERALDAAACIGCGACVAACPNGSASLFVAAKIVHLNMLPQGAPERKRRTAALVARADAEGFGGCTLHGECQDACPKGISLETIVHLHRETLATFFESSAPHSRPPRRRAARHSALPAAKSRQVSGRIS